MLKNLSGIYAQQISFSQYSWIFHLQPVNPFIKKRVITAHMYPTQSLSAQNCQAQHLIVFKRRIMKSIFACDVCSQKAFRKILYKDMRHVVADIYLASVLMMQAQQRRIGIVVCEPIHGPLFQSTDSFIVCPNIQMGDSGFTHTISEYGEDRLHHEKFFQTGTAGRLDTSADLIVLCVLRMKFSNTASRAFYLVRLALHYWVFAFP
ncbi:hypothetical protein DR91_2084 [Neisseria lactamica ATCC 23970]|nr:hypothetical protein DR91_2084 [Neisseria lactamica ATCC 23970]